MNETEKTLLVRPFTLKQLAKLYGIHPKTMLQWIKPFKEKVGKPIGRYYMIRQVLEVFKWIGTPDLRIKHPNNSKPESSDDSQNHKS